MADLPLPVRLLCLVIAALGDPSPGRVPKVYNALITSDQNLEPSKAFPVYQPVLHDAFAFPFQPSVFYGDYPLTNALLPAAAVPPLPAGLPAEAKPPVAPAPTDGPSAVPPAPSKVPISPGFPAGLPSGLPNGVPIGVPVNLPDGGPTGVPAVVPPAASPSAIPVAPPIPNPADPKVLPSASPSVPPASHPGASAGITPTPAPPLPPNTQSPIPLNEFGLPPQVLPLGRIDPSLSGFSQVGPFTYAYPGFKFYDPYNPFGFNPYLTYGSPLYRPLSNILEPGIPLAAAAKAPAPDVSVPAATSAPALPRAPSALNLLNYASKDPSIPNVPPPPLPDGGLKSD